MSILIPKNMQAVLIREIGGPLTIGEVPVPAPGPGEVLVRMAAGKEFHEFLFYNVNAINQYQIIQYAID